MNDDVKAPNPRLFISYCWSSPEHEDWVMTFATSLVESGVDAILDKWDLREGHDSVAFMEQMVTDPTITKVAIISDAVYAAKADGRQGGVGTETQIISKRVYDGQDRDKFVAVIPSRDADGRIATPTYYAGKIHVDLSEPDRYAENFDKLLRWIFDKPLHVKPQLGTVPSFLDAPDALALGTSVAFRRCTDALRNGRSFADGAVEEYFHLTATNLEQLRIVRVAGTEFDDQVVASIDAFLPYRNELVQIFVAIAQYAPTEHSVRTIHRFFERIANFMFRPEGVTHYRDHDWDNYKFIVHELFLCTVAAFLKSERFALVDLLLRTPVSITSDPNNGYLAPKGFEIYRQHVPTLVERSRRLVLRRMSLRADFLNDRATTGLIAFVDLMQADFVLFLRAEVQGKSWWPETLIYAHFRLAAFELFVRSVSAKYFAEFACVIDVASKSDLEPLFTSYADRSRRLPTYDYERLEVERLAMWDQLATKP